MKILCFFALWITCLQCIKAQQNPYTFSKDILENTDTQYGHQFHAWKFAQVGQYYTALQYWDKEHSNYYRLKKEDSLQFLNYRAVDAVEYILHAADSQQVIMVNEAHHNARHRYFVSELLPGLYKKGFRHLALEGLFKVPKANSPITIGDGFYTKEPEFANLIRKARAIGFSLHPYDAEARNGEREQAQAENIQRILKKSPEAKILVYAGFDHIREDRDIKRIDKAMALRFQELTGINPLTFDQVSMSEHADSTRNNPLLSLQPVSSSSVFIDKNGGLFNDGHRGKQYDAQIFHPKSSPVHGRANWRSKNRTYYPLNAKELQVKENTPVLAIAYLHSETQTAKLSELIPVDLQEFNNKGQESTGLYLFPGEYVLILQYLDQTQSKQTIQIR